MTATSGEPPLGVGIDVRKVTGLSGQARYLWRLGAWLADRGHRVEILTVREQPPEVEAAPGVRLHRLHGLSRRALRAYVRDLELDALLLNPERSRRYRGLGANVLRPGYGTEHFRQKMRSFRTPAGAAARRLLRVTPWVLAERRWERRFYEGHHPPPEVIANSGYMRREILHSYDVPPAHVHVVHNGVDLDEFSPAERARLRAGQRREWGIPDEAVCLLFMGHNFRLKGLWQMLRILGRLRGEAAGVDLRALVVGSGSGRGQLRKVRRLVEGEGLAGAVHLTGAVRPAMRAFAAADVLVHLSWHDSFGFVVLEAMAAGVPVLTTRFTGASELMEDGISGRLVHPGDAEEALQGVRELLDPGTRAAMGAAASEVASRHPEEENFRRVLDVLRTAEARSRGPVR